MPNLDLALLILGAWVVLAIPFGVLFGKAIRGPRFDSQGRERVGLSPTLRDAQERQERAERALDRFGKKAS